MVTEWAQGPLLTRWICLQQLCTFGNCCLDSLTGRLSLHARLGEVWLHLAGRFCQVEVLLCIQFMIDVPCLWSLHCYLLQILQFSLQLIFDVMQSRIRCWLTGILLSECRLMEVITRFANFAVSWKDAIEIHCLLQVCHDLNGVWTLLSVISTRPWLWCTCCTWYWKSNFPINLLIMGVAECQWTTVTICRLYVVLMFPCNVIRYYSCWCLTPFYCTMLLAPFIPLWNNAFLTYVTLCKSFFHMFN